MPLTNFIRRIWNDVHEIIEQLISDFTILIVTYFLYLIAKLFLNLFVEDNLFIIAMETIAEVGILLIYLIRTFSTIIIYLCKKIKLIKEAKL